MKKISLLLGTLLVAASSNAATIEWGNGGGRGHMFVLGNGTRVAAGSLVRVGYFEEAGNPSSAFVEFGTTTLSNPGGDAQGGHILGTGQTITNAATTFNNRQLYIWVYNAPTAAAATSSEIFTSVEWLTPAGFNTPDATFAIRLGAAAGGTPPVVTNLQGPGDAQPGSYTVGGITISGGTNGNGSIYNLGVPEPSTAMMGLLAGLGLIARRRR
jgi:hypothetical protein